mgnify:CR=1 FL=1
MVNTQVISDGSATPGLIVCELTLITLSLLSHVFNFRLKVTVVLPLASEALTRVTSSDESTGGKELELALLSYRQRERERDQTLARMARLINE